ncbi:hypothetical protein CU097_008585 [Rhizopus azygosporus]|uniref:Uncharacterized protein n=2 Tax=Rhizopus TaxID=4842 RepID=A0A367J6V3_RHIAZ|nr:hypothetical protein CU097_008585 [Rhizopus azygosporus]
MDTAVVEKPKTSTAPKATKVSDTFKRIFIQAKALKEASALVSAASITAIGNQAQRSVILLNDVNESEEEEVDIEGDDYEWNAEGKEEGLDGGNDNNENKEEVKVENEEEDITPITFTPNDVPLGLVLQKVYDEEGREEDKRVLEAYLDQFEEENYNFIQFCTPSSAVSLEYFIQFSLDQLTMSNCTMEAHITTTVIEQPEEVIDPELEALL